MACTIPVWHYSLYYNLFFTAKAKGWGSAVKITIHNGIVRRIRQWIQPLGEVKAHFCRSPHQIGALNLAPLTGRRDAALERFTFLIGENLPAVAVEPRLQAYGRLIDLLDEIIDTTLAISHQHDERRRAMENDLMRYAVLLRDALQSVADFALQQQALNGNGQAHPVEHELFISRHSAVILLSESELRLYHDVCAMINLSHPQTLKYQEYCRKLFSRQTFTRYQRALDEYRQFYQSEFPGVTASASEFPVLSDPSADPPFQNS